MVELSVVEDRLLLRGMGADKLWAFKSSLEIPLRNVAGIRGDPSVARAWLAPAARAGHKPSRRNYRRPTSIRPGSPSSGVCTIRQWRRD